MRKVAELYGAELDYWVAKAEGHGCRVLDAESSPIGRAVVVAWPEFHGEGDREQFEPSSDWAAGGPIIERERIGSITLRDGWSAQVDGERLDRPRAAAGPTLLIAAMRAYVASKFGDEVPPIASLSG